MAMLTYKYKLFNAKRNKHLGYQIDIAAAVWNHTIALQRRYYKAMGKYASANRIKKLYTKLKKLPRFAFWKELGSQAIQDVVERVDRSYKAFFSYKCGETSQKRGRPGFRKRSKYKSFTLKRAGYKLLEDEDAICQTPDAHVIPRTGNAVGMDFGLKDFLTMDNGTKISSPLWYRKALPKLRKLQRKLSRCQSGSRHRKAARVQLAKLHDRIADQRRDWFYRLAHRLCSDYATICIEDLNIKAMQRLWGRKVSDLAFAEFVLILEHVASKRGCQVIKIDRWFPSSKMCHICGNIYKELNLKKREWTCACCGTHHDRDINAAINIKAAALT